MIMIHPTTILLVILSPRKTAENITPKIDSVDINSAAVLGIIYFWLIVCNKNPIAELITPKYSIETTNSCEKTIAPISPPVKEVPIHENIAVKNICKIVNKMGSDSLVKWLSPTKCIEKVIPHSKVKTSPILMLQFPCSDNSPIPISAKKAARKLSPPGLLRDISQYKNGTMIMYTVVKKAFFPAVVYLHPSVWRT